MSRFAGVGRVRWGVSALALAACGLGAVVARAQAQDFGLQPPPAILATPAELVPLPDFDLPPPAAVVAPPVFRAADLPPDVREPETAVAASSAHAPPQDWRPADAGEIAALSPPGAPPPFLTPAPDAPTLTLAPAHPADPLVAATPEPASAPQPAVAAAPGLAPEALRTALEAYVDAPAPRAVAKRQRAEREALRGFYEARGFAPLFAAGDDWTPVGRGALGRLARAGEDGLDLSAHPVPTRPGDDAAAAEIALATAAIAYGRQASGGRVDPQRVSALITAEPQTAEPQTILTALAAAADAPAADEALAGFNPPHPGYHALRDKLSELRAERRGQPEVQRIPLGPTLKVGMRDPRVPLIRARFGLDPAADEPQGELIYDTRVASVIADFQKANGLPSSGRLTPRTIAALSGGEPARLENEILANMERWRWLPRDLGARRIEVNIPDFTLTVVEDGAIVHTTRVVVGKPDSPTPVFSDEMKYLIVNPSWYVPPSIIKKEMAPNLAADPNYYTRRGYEVTRKGDQIVIRQPPGERNALGNIKFMFPNRHAVYLHDTPSRALFAQERRAFSHGCVRVDKPLALAEVVLGKDNGWSEERVKKMIGRGERMVNLPRKLPVHLQYFTAFVDAAGRLQLRDDIYGFSRRLKIAMGLER